MMIYSDPTATEFENTALLAGSPYFQHVLSSFRCPLRAARLMRLTPGSLIKEHSDHELSAEEGFARLHIPVTTNPDVEFFLNGSRVILEAGSTWYLRLSDPHRVHNRGATDRVHIVIDAVVDAWLLDLLESSLKKAA
jgi:hypothetical protein